MKNLLFISLAFTGIFSISAQGQNSAWFFEEHKAHSFAPLGNQKFLITAVSNGGIMDLMIFNSQNATVEKKETHTWLQNGVFGSNGFANSNTNTKEVIGKYAYQMMRIRDTAKPFFYKAGLVKISTDSLKIVDHVLVEDTNACCNAVWISSMKAINSHEFIALGFRKNLPNGRLHPFVVKLDTNMTVKAFKKFDEPEKSILFQSFMLAQDGSLVIGGSVYENGFLKGAVYKLDSLLNVEWAEEFDTRSSNTELTDGEFFIAPTNSTNEFWAIQHRAMHCDGRNCSGSMQYRQHRLIKMDLQGNVISESLVGPKMRGIIVRSIDVDSTGFVIAGLHFHPKSAVGYVYNFDNDGNELWLSEPNIEQYRNEFHYLYSVRKIDGLIYASGQMIYKLNQAQWSYNTFFTALNQNGCYLNNVCPGYIVSVEENQLAKTVIFPNPAQDYFYITSPGNEVSEIKIFNATGQQVYYQATSTPGAAIDVSMLTSGMYYVQFNNETGTIQQKLVVGE